MPTAETSPVQKVKNPVDDTKRLSLNLSDMAYKDLASLAKQRRSSMTEVVRLALGLAKVAIREDLLGNKLVICKADGTPVREIILP